MSWTKILIGMAAAGMAGVVGCTVGPDYHPAAVRAPAAWSSPVADGLTNSASAASTWWKSFNDSELDSLIQRAVRSNLDLRVSEARLRQARAMRERSAANLMPTVDGSAAYARQLQSENQPLIGALPLPPNFPFEYNVYQAGFDASWEIDVFGGKRRALQAATAEWQGTMEARNDAMLSLLAEVARNYVELRGGQHRLEIAQKDLKLQEEALELTRARFQSGVANELDVSRSAALFASQRAVIPPLESAVRGTIYGIAVLLLCIGHEGVLRLLQRSQNGFLISRQRGLLDGGLGPNFRPHPTEIERPPLQTRAKRPEKAARLERLGQGDTFTPYVPSEGKFGKPVRFRHSNAGGLGCQLPFGLANVRTAAEKIGGKPDRNFRGGRRHWHGRRKFGHQFARLLPEQDRHAVHGRPHPGNERRNPRPYACKQGRRPRDVKFARESGLKAGAG